MKITKSVGLFVVTVLPFISAQGQAPVVQVPSSEAQAQVQAPVDLSPGAAEVIRLAESGAGDDVVLAYIRNSGAPFTLSADHVLYLKDLGLSSEVLSAMLNHDSTLRLQAPTPSRPPVVEAPLVPTQPVVEQPPPVYMESPPAEVSYFYSDLAPYGTWVDLEGFGWCWQPRAIVINRGWRPYCDGGHWVYSDAGWYWASDYSWGWAPFHYGRWQLHDRCGWVWLPDRVWGPAWVTWRVGGDRCGWAPLPPHTYFEAGRGWRRNGISVGVNVDFGLRPDHFTFVALHDFSDRDVRRHSLATTEVRNVFKQTTVINNYTVVNNTVVNHGIPVDRVATATHREITRASIRDLPADPGRVSAVHRSDQSGSVVYRTQLKTTPSTPRVAVQKVDQRHPVIQHPVVATTQAERRTYTGGSYGAPTTTRRSEGQTPQTPQRSTVERGQSRQTPQPSRVERGQTWQAPQRPTGERAPTSTPTRPEPRVYQPAPAAPSAPSAPPASRPSDDGKAPNRPSSLNRPTWEPPSSRSAANTPTQPTVSRSESRGGNPQVYYPKTSHQSSEVRAATPSPPRSERAAERSERSSSESPGHHSKKNEP